MAKRQRSCDRGFNGVKNSHSPASIVTIAILITIRLLISSRRVRTGWSGDPEFRVTGGGGREIGSGGEVELRDEYKTACPDNSCFKPLFFLIGHFGL